MNIFEQYTSYIRDNPKNHWFKAKLYGWGWTPATWHGWVTTLIYVFLITLIASRIDDSSPTKEVVLMFVFPTVLLTTLFIYIAYKKGEKPKWNWGKPRSQ